MENSLYHGKTICTYDLKDEHGFYYEEQVLDWKQAAADRQLTCSECGAPVYLAAGPIKEPYFAHYDLENCDYGNSHESEELKKGKRLLYQLLRRSFPDSDIQARVRMENGMYSTLYCILEKGRSFAIDYRLMNNSLEKFRNRDTFYQENKIRPIYVMGKRQEKSTKQLDWYQNLLQNTMGYLVYLDTDSEEVTLKKGFNYRIGNSRKFAYCLQTYPLHELQLDEEGQMICGFTEECHRLHNQIQEEKKQHQRRQEQLKNLQEEMRRKEAEDLRRQEEYRVAKELEQHGRLEPERAENTDNSIELNPMEYNPVLLEKCRKMIAEGEGHLVSRKYYDAIMKGL